MDAEKIELTQTSVDFGPMVLKAAGASHVGMCREENQDAFLLMAHQNPPELLAVVADGMGGLKGGAVASKLAVGTFDRWFRGYHGIEECRNATDFREQFLIANEAIRSASSANPSLSGMGTTAVALYASQYKVVHFYAGDSRLYRFRNGHCFYQTKDHSTVQNLIDIGAITASQARHHHLKHEITSYLGGYSDRGPTVSPSIEAGDASSKLKDGELLLLCSDGLCGEVMESQIMEVVNKFSNDEAAVVRNCISLALRNGGRDNISVIAIRFYLRKHSGDYFKTLVY